jgi:hypothetical protein
MPLLLQSNDIIFQTTFQGNCCDNPDTGLYMALFGKFSRENSGDG